MMQKQARQIATLTARIAELETRLAVPPKNPDNSSLPPSKLGVFMGLFNVFVVVPQLLVSTVMGSILKLAFPNQPVWTMAFAAGGLIIAAFCSLRVGSVNAA